MMKLIVAGFMVVVLVLGKQHLYHNLWGRHSSYPHCYAKTSLGSSLIILLCFISW